LHSSVNQNIHENLIQEFHIEAAIPKSNWRVETLNNFYGQEEKLSCNSHFRILTKSMFGFSEKLKNG
jgi:hypothetical protein